MSPNPSSAFEHGQPVWAHMEGYPWWPGRIVTRDEVTLDAGEGEPRVRTGEVLVEFFNDNKRFAPMSERHLRSFLNMRYSKLNAQYSGQYKGDLNDAVQEAKEYCDEKGLKIVDDGPRSRPVKPKSTSHEEEGFIEDDEDERAHGKEKLLRRKNSRSDRERDRDIADDTKSKRGKKRPSKESGTEPQELDQERGKKRKRKLIHLEKSTERVLDKDDHDVPPKPEKRQKQKKKRKHRDLTEEESTSRARDGKDARRKSPSPAADEVHAPDQLDSREHKRRKETKHDKEQPAVPKASQPDEAQEEAQDVKDEPVGEENQVEARREKRDRKQKRGHLEKTSDTKLTESGPHRRSKKENKVPSSPEGSQKDVNGSNEKLEGIGNEPTSPYSDEGVPCEEGAMYMLLSKEQLINVLVARDRELRSYGAQLWRYRLANAKEDGPRTANELITMCAPAFKAVADFLTVSASEDERKEKSGKWKELESLAIENIRKLHMKYFDISLLKEETKLAARAIKLAQKSAKYSWEVAMAFRELLLQWTEIGAVEYQPEDEPASRYHDTNTDSGASREKFEPAEKVVKSLKSEAIDEKVDERDTKHPEDMIVDTKGVDKKSPESKNAEESPVEDGHARDKSPMKSKIESKSSMANNEKVPRRTRSGNGSSDTDKHSPAGTPQREARNPSESPCKSSDRQRTSPKGDNDSASKRHKLERLVHAFTIEKCVQTLQNCIATIAAADPGRVCSDEKKQMELAETIERLILPHREDDAFTYFKVARKLCRALNSLSLKDECESEDARRTELRDAFFECVKDKTTIPGFLKRFNDSP